MRTRRRASTAFSMSMLATLAATALLPRPAYAEPCEPHWAEGFALGAPDDYVYSQTVFDDGSGPALYAGGDFYTVGGVQAICIAKWNGGTWSPLGSGTSGSVMALSVFDDGDGPLLIAGGGFTTAGGVAANRIAKWNGGNWSPLGSGLSGTSFPSVYALAVFDDGSGTALYAGGSFTTAGNVTANYIAKWDGESWSRLGSGLNGWVSALTVFDDGNGPALYASGGFTTAGGVAANYIAKWNGSTWSPLGSGLSGGGGTLAVFDDGSGSALYVGGEFTTAGGVRATHVAKWNGVGWSSLGSNGVDGPVYALTVFDDSSGPALFAGGYCRWHSRRAHH